MNETGALRRKVDVTHARVVQLALPMTLATMSTPLLGLVDATVIGRLGQASLLGAIAACAVIFDFLYWGFSFLRQGTAGLVAQSVGAGDDEEERASTLRALILAFVVAVLMIALQKAIAGIAFFAMDATPAVTAAAKTYFAIRIWSAPFTLTNYVVLGAVLGRGRMDIGLRLQIFINVLNMMFNIALVAGFHLGVRGSAFGTLMAEALGTGVGLFVLWRLHGKSIRMPWSRILDRQRLRRMIGMNRDIMIRSASLLGAFAFFTAQGARGGDVTLAANAVLMNLFLVAAYFLDGFATAAEQMCGQSLGARDPAGFRAAVWLTTIWCLAFSAIVSALAFLGGNAFIDFVSTDPQVRAFARAFLPFAALTPILGALAFEFDGVFIGATWTRDMRNLMLAALAFYFALFFLLRPLGNAGLWIALLGFLLARGVLQAWRYQALARQSFPELQDFASTPTAAATLE